MSAEDAVHIFIAKHQELEEDDGDYNLEYGDDEKEHEPEDLQHYNSIAQHTHTLVDSQETRL